MGKETSKARLSPGSAGSISRREINGYLFVLPVAAVLAALVVYLIDAAKLEGLLPTLMEKLSLFERFYPFVNGIFDWTSVVFYGSVIVFFLFLTVMSLEKRRYN